MTRITWIFPVTGFFLWQEPFLVTVIFSCDRHFSCDSNLYVTWILPATHFPPFTGIVTVNRTFPSDRKFSCQLTCSRKIFSYYRKLFPVTVNSFMDRTFFNLAERNFCCQEIYVNFIYRNVLTELSSFDFPVKLCWFIISGFLFEFPVTFSWFPRDNVSTSPANKTACWSSQPMYTESNNHIKSPLIKCYTYLL